MIHLAYSSYRKSEVDWLDIVPTHWINVPIKYMALEKQSLFLDGDWIESKDITDGNIRYITTGNVGEGQYKEQGAGFITQEKFIELDCTEVYEGDILMSRLNAPIGRSCIVPNLESRIVTSVDNVIFRPDSKYNKKFLVYLFSSKDFFIHTSNLARGATMQRISRGLLGNVRVVAPPYDEQQKITNFLDYETAKIDTLIAKQQQLIALLKEKRQAVISHAVTKGLNPNALMRDSGVEWLGKVPAHWGISRVKFHCSVKGRIGFRGYTVEDLVDKDEGALVLGASEMNALGEVVLNTPQYISWVKYFESPEIMLEEGMVLVVQRGSTVGKVAIIPAGLGKATINPSLIVLRDLKIIPIFMSYSLMSSLIKNLVDMERSSTAIPMISQEQVGNYWLLVPPEQEQRKIGSYIAEKIKKVDNAIGSSESLISLMQERRTALISAAVTGKIDVRGWQATESLAQVEQ